MLGGLKTTALVATAAGVVISALWWQLGNAKAEADEQRERAGALRAQLDQASGVAQRNADRAAELAAEIQRLDQIMTDYHERLEQRRHETAQLLTELEEASRAAPARYQECLAVPLPRGIGELLRVDTGARDPRDHRDRDSDRPPTGQPDEALPGA